MSPWAEVIVFFINMTWQNIKRWRNQLIFVAEVMQFFPKQVLRSQLSQEYIQLGQLSRKRRSMNQARDLFPYFHTVGWQTEFSSQLT